MSACQMFWRMRDGYAKVRSRYDSSIDKAWTTATSGQGSPICGMFCRGNGMAVAEYLWTTTHIYRTKKSPQSAGPLVLEISITAALR